MMSSQTCNQSWRVFFFRDFFRRYFKYLLEEDTLEETVISPAPFDGHNPSIKISSFSSRLRSLWWNCWEPATSTMLSSVVGWVQSRVNFKTCFFPLLFHKLFFMGYLSSEYSLFVVVVCFLNSWTFFRLSPSVPPPISVHTHVKVRGQTSGQCSRVLCEIQRLHFLVANAFTYSTI